MIERDVLACEPAPCDVSALFADIVCQKVQEKLGSRAVNHVCQSQYFVVDSPTEYIQQQRREHAIIDATTPVFCRVVKDSSSM